MAFKERKPQERETLIFSTAEQAGEFRDGVAERVAEQGTDVRREREIIAEAVADELAAHGEGGHSLEYPWQHTPEEHAEVQGLVDTAFEHDVTTALKTARRSEHYPRNIDLLHDTLTTELYEGIIEHRINQQPVLGSVLLVLSLGVVVGIVLLAVWFAL